MKQPAKDWLADALENLGGMLGKGEDPSFIINIYGVVIEIRLNTLPGNFERQKIQIK
jgi:hypothetical protein